LSTFLYNKAKSDFATAALNWPTCTPKAMLVDANYTPSPAHQYVSDITSGIVIRDLVMSSVAQANGVCSGTLPGVSALLWPNPVVALVIYASTGVDATSRLIYYSSDGLGFPINAIGFNYAISYDQGYAGWFQV
jgi:hypothetical protein